MIFFKKKCDHELFIIYKNKTIFGEYDYHDESKAKCLKCKKEFIFYNEDELHNTIAYYNALNNRKYSRSIGDDY